MLNKLNQNFKSMKNRKDYPENWEDEIRPKVLERDKFRCQQCGIKHRKSYIFPKNGVPISVTDEEMKEAKKYGEKAYKVFLQIAHLDGNPSNNEMSNLLALCPKDHLNYDRKRNNLSKKVKFVNKSK